MAGTSCGRSLGAAAGSARSWKAHDRTLGRDVAIKLINMDAIGGRDREEIAHRFLREARAVAGLNHPNVVAAYDFGVQDDTAYLVMELVTAPRWRSSCAPAAAPARRSTSR